MTGCLQRSLEVGACPPAAWTVWRSAWSRSSGGSARTACTNRASHQPRTHKGQWRELTSACSSEKTHVVARWLGPWQVSRSPCTGRPPWPPPAPWRSRCRTCPCTSAASSRRSSTAARPEMSQCASSGREHGTPPTATCIRFTTTSSTTYLEDEPPLHPANNEARKETQSQVMISSCTSLLL